MDELDVINLNPKCHSCWGSEKWLFKIKQIVKVTHGHRSVRLRGLQRYYALLKVRFSKRSTMRQREMPKVKNIMHAYQGLAPNYGVYPTVKLHGACPIICVHGACPWDLPAARAYACFA